MELVPVDLSRATPDGRHPDIKLGALHLARIRWNDEAVWCTGRFYDVWFGLLFDPVGGAFRLQFDDARPYRTAAPEWLELYEIVYDEHDLRVAEYVPPGTREPRKVTIREKHDGHASAD